MGEMSMFKIAFVGTSGHSLTAFRHIQDNLEPRAEVVAYCKGYAEEDPSVIEMWSGELIYPKLKMYDDLKLMLDETEPDVLVVDGRCAEHAAMSKEALDRGISVYCDKPLALDEKELLDLYKLAEKKSCVYWSMQSLRFELPMYTAKRLMTEENIGILRMISLQKSYKLGKRPAWHSDKSLYGSLIPRVGIQGIDLIRYFSDAAFKSVSALTSSAHNKNYKDFQTAAMMNFELENDILAEVRVDFYRPDNADTTSDTYVRIVGTEGTIEIKDGVVKLFNSKCQNEEQAMTAVPIQIFTAFLFTLEAKKNKNASFAFIPEHIRLNMDAGMSNRECLYMAQVSLRANRAAEEKITEKLEDIFAAEIKEREEKRLQAEAEALKAMEEDAAVLRRRKRLEAAKKKKQESKK